LGIAAALLALGCALGALAYAREGSRQRGWRRAANLCLALPLGVLARGECIAVQQNVARARSPVLLSQPADLTSLVAVVVWVGVVVWAGHSAVRRCFPVPA
jgi:hypothetical protein